MTLDVYKCFGEFAQNFFDFSNTVCQV